MGEALYIQHSMMDDGFKGLKVKRFKSLKDYKVGKFIKFKS